MQGIFQTAARWDLVTHLPSSEDLEGALGTLVLPTSNVMASMGCLKSCKWQTSPQRASPRFLFAVAHGGHVRDTLAGSKPHLPCKSLP